MMGKREERPLPAEANRQINKRPGEVVALTDRFGDIALYDPAAWRRREHRRKARGREAERGGDTDE